MPSWSKSRKAQPVPQRRRVSVRPALAVTSSNVAVAAVVVEPALAVVGHVEVREAVVVVVAGAHALPPAARGEPRARGHVLEAPVAPVAIEVIRRLLPLRKALERRAVHEEGVLPAVVVEVEKGGAAAGRFEQVAVPLAAAEDGRRGQARLRGHVGEGEGQAVLGERTGHPEGGAQRQRCGAPEDDRPHGRGACDALVKPARSSR